jgi:hypothetical protein
MTPHKPDDKLLDDYLRGNSALSDAYRAGRREEPSADLDAAILAASRHVVTPSRARRWAIPLSAAATILLAAGLGILLTREGANPVAPPAAVSPESPAAPAKPEATTPVPARKQQPEGNPTGMAAQRHALPTGGAADYAAESAGQMKRTGSERRTDAMREKQHSAATGNGVTAHADIVKVTVTGEPGAYRFNVTIRSDDLGCDRYADWWEVVSADGKLLYRRILAHSHVDEQPFARDGGPVPAAPDTVVWVRAHMHPDGYTGKTLRGFAGESRRGFLCCSTLLPEERVDLGGADEVVFRQSVHRVRAETHSAAVIADLEVGMVVFAMDHPGHRIHKGNGLVIVREAKPALDGGRTVVEHPAGGIPQQRLRLGARKCRAGARFARLLAQTRHGRPRENDRTTR